MPILQDFLMRLRGGAIGSTRRAKIGRQDIKKSYKGFHHLKDDVHDIESMITSRNAEGVKQEFNDFLRDFFIEENILVGVTDSNEIIEYRVITKFSEIFQILDSIVKDPKLDEQSRKSFADDIRKLHHAFSKAQHDAKEAVHATRALTADKESVADKRISADEWLLRMMKIHARHFKNAAKHEQHAEHELFDVVEKIVRYMHKEVKGSAQIDSMTAYSAKEIKRLLQKAHKSIEKSADVVREIFDDAAQLEDDITTLLHRLRNMELEELRELHELGHQGFPQEFIDQVQHEAEIEDKKVADRFHQAYQKAIKIRRKNHELAN